MSSAPASVALPLQVALVEDDPALRDATLQALMLEGAEVAAFPDARAALGWLTADYPGVVVSDVRMPGMDGIAFFAALREIDPDLPVILVTGHGDIAMAVEAMKNGAADFLTKPYASADLIRAVRSAAMRRALALENRRLREETGRGANGAIPGSSPAAERLRAVIEGVARSEIDVVLSGPHGTGKSHAARLIHDLGPRRGRPFVAVDAGVLAHEDAELLLFGRDPAAGGAGLSRTGLVERANGGTLFLDGIAAAGSALAARLLALVETRQVFPIGAAQPRRLNLRIIIARSDDAAEARDPQWHRLGAVQIAFPPLDQRREDVAELFRLFTARHARDLGLAVPAIGEAEWRHVLAHEWPGNLHELSAYARAFVLGLTGAGVAPPLQGERSLAEIVAEFERTVLEDALRRCRGDVARLQAMLRTPRKTIYDKLAKHDLKPSRFR
jgi:two-component system C4-dicarboxylate transport response regulator DctD